MSDEMKMLERMGKRVAQALGDGPTDERMEAQKRAVLSMINAPVSRRDQRLVPVLAAAAVVLVILLAATLVNTRKTPMEFWVGESKVAGSEGSWVKSDSGESVAIGFDGGSEFTLEGESSARVVKANTEDVNLDLSRGEIYADVKPGGETRWSVNAGPYTVSVLGTAFQVGWDESDSLLNVSVERGLVLVTGGHLSEHGIKLAAGKRLVADGDRGSVAVESIPDEDDGSGQEPLAAQEPQDPPVDEVEGSVAAADEVETISEPAEKAKGTGAGSKVGSRPEAMPQWRQLMGERDYAGAVSAAREEGLDELLGELGEVDLWKLAKAARFAKDHDASSKAYEAVRDRFVGSRRASTAAFMLGRLEADQRGSHGKAARWFETYLSESPGGPLAEEALGRLMDACDKSGRKEAASRYASEYLAKHDDGLFAKLAKSILSR